MDFPVDILQKFQTLLVIGELIGICIIFCILIQMLVTLKRVGFLDYLTDLYWVLRKNHSIKTVYRIQEKLKTEADVEKTIRLRDDLVKHTTFVQSFNPYEEEEVYSINMEDVELTESIFEFIDKLIKTEVTNKLIKFTSTRTKIEVLKTDEYIRDISTRVSNALNLDIFNTSMLCNSEYIHRYIVETTTDLVISVILNHNNNISG